MKKTTFLMSFLVAVLWVNTGLVWAGGVVGKPKTAKHKATYAKVVKQNSRPRTLQPVPAKTPSVSSISHPSLLSFSVRQNVSNRVGMHPSAGLYLPRVGEEVPALVQRTFQARPQGTDFNFLSGTVFQTPAGEIFGVVVSHGLARSGSAPRVERKFEADVFDVNSRRFVTVPAEIVQLSAPEFLDIALVKFNLPAEVKLRSFVISQEENLWRRPMLHSQSFSLQEPVHIANRMLRNTTPYSIRTLMPWPRGSRRGLCGGAVLNEENELVGIHTGSFLSKWSEAEDLGYATPAQFLNILVEAYHNNGKAVIPFILAEEHIIDLNVNEYVSKAVLLDADLKVITEQTFTEKFAYHQLVEKLEMYRPRYITLTVHRVSWSEEETSEVLEDDRQDKSTQKVYRYDFETQEIRELTPEELN